MTTRINFDAKRCQGHTMCAMNAPELFDLSDEDGHAIVKISEVPPELVDSARIAVDGCPENAISLSES